MVQVHIYNVLQWNKRNASPGLYAILFYYERNRCSFDSVQFSETALFSSRCHCQLKTKPYYKDLRCKFPCVWFTKVKSRWVLVVGRAPRWIPTSIESTGKFMFMNWEICHKRYERRAWTWNAVNNFHAKRFSLCVDSSCESFCCSFIC